MPLDGFTDIGRGIQIPTEASTGNAGIVEDSNWTIVESNLDEIESDLTNHATNTSNPHSVTKSQVGLSAVSNDQQLIRASNLSDLASVSTARTNLGLGTAALAASSDFAAAIHTHSISEVTSLQTALDAKASATDLTSHTTNTSNPHSVTKTQVGLGNVANSLQLIASNNLSDLASASTARTNLGLVIGSNVPALSHEHAAGDITSGTLANSRTSGTADPTQHTLALRDATGSFAVVTLAAGDVQATEVIASTGEFATSIAVSSYASIINGCLVLTPFAGLNGILMQPVDDTFAGDLLTVKSWQSTVYLQVLANGQVVCANGSGLAGLSASNISAGTLDDARLSSNISRLNATQTYTAAKTIYNSSGGITPLTLRYGSADSGNTAFLSCADSAGTTMLQLRQNSILANQGIRCYSSGVGGNEIALRIDQGGLNLTSSTGITWSNSTSSPYSTKDTGLARSAAGIVQVTNAAGGNGQLLCDRITFANSEYIKNDSDGRMDFMPNGTSASHFGLRVIMTSTGGVQLTTVRASDGALNGAFIRFDAQPTVNDDVGLAFGASSHSRIRHTLTGNDTLQIGTTPGASNSGAVVILNSAHFAVANRSPTTLHTDPTLYIYSTDSGQANDYIRLSHDQTNALIEVGNGNLYIDADKVDLNTDVIRLRTAKTPSSASDTGAAGDICWDSGFLYVCTATDTWKRVAIATW